MNIHLFTSYFDVNRRGTIGFDTLPYGISLSLYTYIDGGEWILRWIYIYIDYLDGGEC
jgi:hypothetical protein